MRVIFLFLTVAMFTVFNAQAQEVKKEVKKKIIIIEKDQEGKTIQKEMLMNGSDDIEIELDDFNVDSLIQELMKGMKSDKKARVIIMDKDGDKKTIEKEITTDVEVTVDDVSGARTITIRSSDGGEEELIEWTEDRENQSTSKTITNNSSEEMTVKVDATGGGRKIIITTNENGEEKVIEWEGEEGDEMPAEFEVVVDESWVDVEELPQPKVSLGVAIQDETKIAVVMEGSAAYKADLRMGDIIKKIDQQIIYSTRGLLEHLTSYELGDTVTITYERDGVESQTKLKLQARD